MTRRQSQFKVKPAQFASKGAVGGARPIVQATAEGIASNQAAPMLAARIYSSPSLKHYDDSDPRFVGKSDNVENIYLPAETVAESPKRAGIAQIFNWLFKGEMR